MSLPEDGSCNCFWNTGNVFHCDGWLHAKTSLQFVRWVSNLFVSLHLYFQLPIHHKLISAFLSQKKCLVYFGSWKNKQNSVTQHLSTVLHQSVLSVVFIIASYKVKAHSILIIAVKITVFWEMTPCSLVERYQHFRGPLTEVTDSSEMSVPCSRLQSITY